MYLNSDLLQLLRSCTAEPLPVRNSTCLEFPLEEFLYTVLADRMELRAPFCSLASLPELVDEYRSQHPVCTLTAEGLLSEGWLSPFLDRWDFSIWPHQENPEEGALPPKRRESAAFLFWLTDRGKDHYEIFVPRFDEVLRRFQMIFPQMPACDWFIQEGFLSPDGQYLSRGRQGSQSAEAGAGALARLWNHWSSSQETAQADRWLDLAMILGAMHGAFEKLAYEQQQFLLERIIARLETGRYPDIPAENRRIFLAETWRRAPGEIDSSWQPLSGDLLSDFQTFDRSSWNWNRTLHQRRRILHSYLWVLCNHLDLLDCELRKRAVNIILPLVKIGCLNDFSLSPESLLCLWYIPQTSLLACDQMFSRSLHKPKLQDELFTGTLRQIVDEVLFDPTRPAADGLELSQLLLFFARQPKGGRVGELGDLALAQLLTELKRRRKALEPQLETISHELERRMVQADDRLDWCRDFRLACLLTQELYYYRGSLSAARETPSCRLLRKVLFTQYIRLFQPDAELLKDAPSLLDTDCFSYLFWNDIYRERKGSLRELTMFLQPDISSESSTSSRVDVYHKCEIHLAVLTVLMQNRKDPDSLLEQVFAQFLTRILLPKHKLLDYNSIAITNALPLLEKAIGFVRTSQEHFTEFLQGLKYYGLPELVLVYHGAQDENLKKRCLHLIQERVRAESLPSFIFNEESLVQLILDAQIECLYPIAEQMLTRRLNHWEKDPGPAFQQAANQTTGQLNRVWLQQKEYDRILEQGNLFYRAIVLMESAEHRDLNQAESIWMQLLDKALQPAYVINLIYTYVLLYEQEEQGNEGKKYILAQTDEVRERVENGPYASWEKDEKEHYAVNLFIFYLRSGKDRNTLIQSLCAELGVDAALFENLDAQEAGTPQIESVEIPLKSPVPALQTYCTASLNQKAEWFFQSKSCEPVNNPQNALLVWCVMNTCDHLIAYGPQLLFQDHLMEDHCTQLFRELFNQAYPEMFSLEVNDQEQTGRTASQGKQGQAGIAEVDLTFKNQGHAVAIGEALRLDSMDKSQVFRHIHKLLGNNIQHIPMFLLVYVKTDDPESLWQKYRDYVQNEFSTTSEDKHWGSSSVTEFAKSEDFIFDLHNSFYFHRHMLRMTFGDQEQHLPPMYHIFLSIGSQENISAAAAARGKSLPKA